MKILGSIGSRAIAKLSVDEHLPIGGVRINELTLFVQAKYEFASPQIPHPHPMSFMGGTPPGLAIGLQGPTVFSNGAAEIQGIQSIAVQQLVITPDFTTLICTTDTTENAQLFLKDLLFSLQSEFGFRSIDSCEWHYASGIALEFSKEFESYFRKLAVLRTLISKEYRSTLMLKQDVGIERISFSIDPDDLVPSKAQFIAPFVIERRANVPYEKNRFFSTAPLSTERHTKLLREIATELEGAQPQVAS